MALENHLRRWHETARDLRRDFGHNQPALAAISQSQNPQLPWDSAVTIPIDDLLSVRRKGSPADPRNVGVSRFQLMESLASGQLPGGALCEVVNENLCPVLLIANIRYEAAVG